MRSTWQDIELVVGVVLGLIAASVLWLGDNLADGRSREPTKKAALDTLSGQQDDARFSRRSGSLTESFRRIVTAPKLTTRSSGPTPGTTRDARPDRTLSPVGRPPQPPTAPRWRAAGLGERGLVAPPAAAASRPAALPSAKQPSVASPVQLYDRRR